MTLRQFIKACGGQQKAAIEIGVRETTLWRWGKKLSRPKGNNLRRLVELGVVVSVAMIVSGCAQTGYLRRRQIKEATADAQACQAELTRMIWAGEKPLLTGRWFSGCMKEHGWERVTLARVAP